MGIDGEDSNVFSAREIVAWYNGLPDCHDTYEKIEQELRNSQTISLIGQGNVAIDVARILLSPLDALAKTDITSRALSTLSECKIQKVHLVGRRGPLQAAFTIKELREMLNLSNVATHWREKDFSKIDDSLVSKLARPKKRIMELMLKQLNLEIDPSTRTKQFFPIFFRSPKKIEIGNLGGRKKLHLIENYLNDAESAIPTNSIEIIPTDVILRSVGYKGVNVTRDDDLLNFDTAKGIVRNSQGRVHQLIERQDGVDSDSDVNKTEPGLYVSGWLGTGPMGVILTTMNNSYQVAKNVCHDIQTGAIDCTTKPGLNLTKYTSCITWQNWLKIDQHEINLGMPHGKPREKILRASEMLEISK